MPTFPGLGESFSWFHTIFVNLTTEAFLVRAAVRADLERSLKTRLLMHTESLNGAEEEELEEKVRDFDSESRESIRIDKLVVLNC